MRLKEISTTTNEIYNLPLDKIEVDPDFNVRHDTAEVAAHLITLRDSMIAAGFLRSKPLIVRLDQQTGKAVIIDGHCRFTAARMAIAMGASIRSLPCISEGKGVSVEERTLMLLTANNGLPLSLLEQADAVKRLLSYGWTELAIGQKIGRTRQHVANLLELSAAPPEVRVMIVNDEVSATEAVKTIRKEGANAVQTLEAAKQKAHEMGRTKITAATIAALKPPRPIVVPPAPASVPRIIQRNVLPLSVSAAHVVEIARHCRHEIPDDLLRAIDALAESLS